MEALVTVSNSETVLDRHFTTDIEASTSASSGSSFLRASTHFSADNLKDVESQIRSKQQDSFVSCVEEKSKPGLVGEKSAPSGDDKVDMADHQK